MSPAGGGGGGGHKIQYQSARCIEKFDNYSTSDDCAR